MAEQRLLKLIVSRVDAPVFEGEVLSVHVPGAAGEMEIMADHEPLISPLKTGTLTIKINKEQKEEYQIDSGTLEISNNQATILI